MELDVVVKIVSLAVVHWILVPIALASLFQRQRVLGGRRGFWVPAVVFLTCIGPLFYLMLHPEPQTQSY